MIEKCCCDKYGNYDPDIINKDKLFITFCDHFWEIYHLSKICIETNTNPENIYLDNMIYIDEYKPKTKRIYTYVKYIIQFIISYLNQLNGIKMKLAERNSYLTIKKEVNLGIFLDTLHELFDDLKTAGLIKDYSISLDQYSCDSLEEKILEINDHMMV